MKEEVGHIGNLADDQPLVIRINNSSFSALRSHEGDEMEEKETRMHVMTGFQRLSSVGSHRIFIHD